MHVVIRQSEQVVSEQAFDSDEITVGLGDGCELRLDGEGIASEVARITQDGDEQWRIEKLDAAADVFINDEPLTERRVLINDDVLKVGEFELNFTLIDTAPLPDEPPLSAEDIAKIKEYPLPPTTIIKRHQEELSLSAMQLERVARMSVALSAARDVNELVEASLEMLVEAFDARMVWMGVRRNTSGELDVVAGRTPAGHSTAETDLLETFRYRCLERGQHICLRKITEGGIGSAMGVPLRTPAGNQGVIYIDRKRGVKRFRLQDLETASALACHIAAGLDSLFQERTQRTAQQSAAEIDLVHTIQAILDPKGGPTWKNFQLAAYGRSGQENPGDVYDIMVHPDNNMPAFMLGHVNATGASLALSMARLHSTFRVGSLHMDPPHALARTLNWLMYDEKDPATVDAFFMLLDPPTGKFRYTRAGRIGGFIVNGRGEPRLVSGADGPSIGRIRNYEYVSKIDQLLPGETMAIYSRGVATATNVDGEKFREKRFIELVCDGFGQRPGQTIQDITDELTPFFTQGTHPDDITVVLLHHIAAE